MTLKKDSKVIIKNREKYELGTILRKWKKGEEYLFHVLTERNIKLEGISCNPEFPCYIDVQKSLKLNEN